MSSSILLLVQYAVAGLTPEERLACTRGLICISEKETLNFFVIGDTGGISFDVSNKFKLGMTRATKTQVEVARSMVHIADKQPLDFIINVGDNV